MALVTDFQSCCTASILYGFGQENAADGDARREGNGKTFEQTKTSILKNVKRKKQLGDGLITAITTNNQENAIKALTELGFLNSGEVRKNRHPENTICLWWLPLKDWVEPVVEVAAPVVANPFVAKPQVVEAYFNTLEERAERNFHGVRDANGRFAPAQVEERPFHIMNLYGKRFGVINNRIRLAQLNNVPVITFASDDELRDVTGKTFQQWENEYRRNGWVAISKEFV